MYAKKNQYDSTPSYSDKLLVTAGLKDEESQNIRDKVTKVLSSATSTAQGIAKKTAKVVNPFLKKNGELINPYLNYQKLLDNEKVSSTAKKYIQQATGLSPTVKESTNPVLASNFVQNGTPILSNGRLTIDISKLLTQTRNATTAGTGMPKSSSNLVNAAKKYMGTPYVWGGESMSEGGMDCSGFVYNALKDAGYKVGRDTAEGYRRYGAVVPLSEAQPGDLVFYKRRNSKTGQIKAGHIAIYIGDGKIIHSSGGSKNTKSNPGKGVSITNVKGPSGTIEVRRL